jgi:hypothetical protein
VRRALGSSPARGNDRPPGPRSDAQGRLAPARLRDATTAAARPQATRGDSMTAHRGHRGPRGH